MFGSLLCSSPSALCCGVCGGEEIEIIVPVRKAGKAIAAKRSSVCGIATLPDELCEAICILVGGTPEDGAERLGRLAGSCRWLRSAAALPRVVRELCAAASAADALAPALKYIALHQAMAKPEACHISFQVAEHTIAPNSRGTVEAVAALMRRHRGARLLVETHAGGGVQLSRKEERAELQTSLARAQSIVCALTALGVERACIQTTSWGAAIAEALPGAAVFVEVDGSVFPQRPAYYSVAQAMQRQKSDDTEGSEQSTVSPASAGAASSMSEAEHSPSPAARLARGGRSRTPAAAIARVATPFRSAYSRWRSSR